MVGEYIKGKQSTLHSPLPQRSVKRHVLHHGISKIAITHRSLVLAYAIFAVLRYEHILISSQVSISCAFLFGCFSLGTALSPNLAAFFIFRMLTAFEGTAFLIVGAAVIGDMYRPTDRATAMGWFLSGTLIGPAFGPFIGGIIVTYTSWRVIFYLQLGLAAVATVLCFFLLPETIHQDKQHLLEGLSLPKKIKVLANLTNPWRVVRLFKYTPLILISLASSSLVWNMYSLLTPIRYVLNPRFGLTSPLLGSLFYLAPGAGYITGTFMGGRWADYTTKKYKIGRAHV